MKKYATYYKCALQVNPCSYSKYRGSEVLDEDAYNLEVLKKCKENNIVIVGLADHGRVDSSEKLRETLSSNDIIVFPGFEITSAEKMHMVCLFPPDKSNSELNQFIGALGLGGASGGTEASDQTCLDIADKIKKLGGFWYAAHITGDSGILKIGKLNKIWKSESLIAAQIPDTKENIDPKYINMIRNKDPQYKRKKQIAYINACDIARPSDLDKETASTLIKMTEPTFENFVLAFKDPDSRIKLNSERENNYQSSIKEIYVSGGYLDEFRCEFSENLTSIIGGRGTGKSTIINLIRYALDLEVEKNLEKDLNSMVDANLGSAGRIELKVISNKHFGEEFKIIRRHKQPPVIKDSKDNVSPLTVKDILPTIEIYGQNEILDIVQESSKINKVIQRLLPLDSNLQNEKKSAYDKLVNNGEKLNKLEDEEEKHAEKLCRLPAIKERLQYYNDAGLENKLIVVKQLATEEGQFDAFIKNFPDEEVNFDKINIIDSKNNELSKLMKATEEFNSLVQKLENEYKNAVNELKTVYDQVRKTWQDDRENYDSALKESLKEIDGIQDKTSEQIVKEYSNLVKNVEESIPAKKKHDEIEKQKDDLLEERKNLIEKYRASCDKTDSAINKLVKDINSKKLNGKVRLSIKFRQQKKPILDKLKCIPNVGEKGLLGIDEYEDFDVFSFANCVRKGADELKNEYSITQGLANKISSNLDEKDLRSIEQLQPDDIVLLELKVNERFKRLNELSKGQQCTAILNILLLDNKDPLVVDQPEDNLDNSFIAENLVDSIRKNKIKRQYIFATHNANIPVFGDAELIVAMEENNLQGKISEDGIGSIDSEGVRNKVVQILEGGPEAFKMREEKYGIK